MPKLAEIQAALAAVFQPTDEIIIPFTATVVRSPQHMVLIDAGPRRLRPADRRAVPSQYGGCRNRAG